jgi:ribosomal protein L11 methylase PrmA
MIKANPASFRDPDSIVFELNGVVYRAIMDTYKEDYFLLKKSGLLDELVESGLLVSHTECDLKMDSFPNAFAFIQPRKIETISYPYEWCFSQLKDAALLTLEIQRKALSKNMSLKDATPFNVQFADGKPIFIDTVSFERYDEGKPWIAYKQFCEQFLGPLSLMAYVDPKFGEFFRINLNGPPLSLVSKLLPLKTYLNLGLLMHIHLHSKFQVGFANAGAKAGGVEQKRIGRQELLAILDSLISTVTRLSLKNYNTEWADYYLETNYQDTSMGMKSDICEKFLKKISPKIIWDFGANTGKFSRLASNFADHVVSFDIDPMAVENNYLTCKNGYGAANILPLTLDLLNPSPSLGWAESERVSLSQRKKPDSILALALVHHIAISNNVPLQNIAEWLSSLCRYLIIEFVPKEDSQVKKLLATRKDIFNDYNQAGFEKSFLRYFDISESEKIEGSCRLIYLMKSKKGIF